MMKIFNSREKSILKILSWAFLYLLFLAVGILMISEYNKYGYYTDYKHGMKFSGEGAKIAAYGVTVFSAGAIFYNIYLLIMVIIEKYKGKKI